jgi:hypothetical protein
MDQTGLIKKDNSYTSYIVIHNKYVKVVNSQVVKGKERFYIQPYQNVHFLLSSNGQMLGLDINKQYIIVQNGITQNPLVVKDGRVYAVDMMNKKLLNMSDQVELRMVMMKSPNETVEEHLRKYISDLLETGNFSEIPI